ncbi:MAG: bifunctional 5,10-methylenetetrahydrofolate dehydrogenase/5,10-methenyltetrahydrofolate cyclohydrolase [Candidatus Doudnabacteria bacterium]|nr:bifunctional 5,10-methylenetetrahydrofolate dehydrogenase/5,10-methenyltetrahydrofolate cyclohydrolase [Candidatus Doudnabacteria bacterium]
MLIDGKAIAQTIYADIAARVAVLPFTPVFCDVLIGNDPASIQYVNMKAKRAEQLGFKFLRSDFPSFVPEADVLTRISEICHMPEVAGLIVQLPAPVGFNQSALVNAISPDIDVDCLTNVNSSLFYAGGLSFVPPTPAAVLAVLDSLTLPPEKLARCVVVGQGDLVGRPVSFLLRARDLEVEIITRETEHPERIARQADVLITAVGRPGLVTAEWVKPGAVLIDAGTAESGGSVVGDVDRASVGDIPAYFSPTPGGVGPVTIAKLFWNVLRVAERKAGISSK